MPIAPKRPCPHPGCVVLVSSGQCEYHKKQRSRDIDERRGSATERGYDGRWQRARKIYLANNPLCCRCLADGRTTAATVVDHIEPHKGDMELFWCESNWQSLCKRCHDRKTAQEDGRWGIND